MIWEWVPKTSRQRKHALCSLFIAVFMLTLRRESRMLALPKETVKNELQIQKTSAHVWPPPQQLLYYNLELNEWRENPIPAEGENFPKDRPVIAALVTSNQIDVEKLANVLKQIDFFLHGDDGNKLAHVLIFNEGDLTDKQEKYLAKSTKRPIAFPLVDLSSFPDGSNYGSAGYMSEQSNRFWLTKIWQHKALLPYGTVMKIDLDSCFMEHNDYLPNMYSPYSEYHSQYVGYKKSYQNNLDELLNFTKTWLDKVKAPSNPMMWQFIKTKWYQEDALPIFRTGFEVFGKGYMRRNGIRKFVEDLTEREPFGVLRQGWDYSTIRFFMAAIFFQNEMIVTSRPKGYAHKDLCKPTNYDKRFKNND